MWSNGANSTEVAEAKRIHALNAVRKHPEKIVSSLDVLGVDHFDALAVRGLVGIFILTGRFSMPGLMTRSS